MNPWLGVLASYLLGAVPSSYIAGRALRGIDLREHGSGNLGATNAFRVLGPRVAAPVMAADVLKGFLPVLLFPAWDTSAGWTWALVYGAAAIVGHVFPVYMGFRGGKGVATAAGVFLALAPLAVGVALAAWIIVVWRSRMVSLASITAALVLVVMLFVTGAQPALLALGIAVAGFVVFAHRSNVARIRRGEESRFGRPTPPRPAPPSTGQTP